MTYFEGPLAKKEGKWVNFWVVLRGDRLWFFRDRETHLQSSLVGAIAIGANTQVKTTKSKASNYQFLVQADQGMPYQLKSNSAQERAQWLIEIGRCARGEPVGGRLATDPLPASPASNGDNRLKHTQIESGSPGHHLQRSPTVHQPPVGLGPSVELFDYAWFYGPLKREKADELLSTRGEIGSFLIRESESTAQSYSLSFLAEERIRHYRIIQATSGYALAGLENQSFAGLPELVRYYIQVNDGWAKPMSRHETGGAAVALRKLRPSVKAVSGNSPPPIVPKTPRPVFGDGSSQASIRTAPPHLRDTGKSQSVPPQLVFKQQQSTRVDMGQSRRFNPDTVQLTERRASSATPASRPPPPNTPRPPLQKRPSEPTLSLPQTEAAPSKLLRIKSLPPTRHAEAARSASQPTSYENTAAPPVMPRSAQSLEGSGPKPSYNNWPSSPQASEELSSDEDGDSGIYIRAAEVDSGHSNEVQYVNHAEDGDDPHDYLDLLASGNVIQMAPSQQCDALSSNLDRQLRVSTRQPPPPAFPPTNSRGQAAPPLPGETKKKGSFR